MPNKCMLLPESYSSWGKHCTIGVLGCLFWKKQSIKFWRPSWISRWSTFQTILYIHPNIGLTKIKWFEGKICVCEPNESDTMSTFVKMRDFANLGVGLGFAQWPAHRCVQSFLLSTVVIQGYEQNALYHFKRHKANSISSRENLILCFFQNMHPKTPKWAMFSSAGVRFRQQRALIWHGCKANITTFCVKHRKELISAFLVVKSEQNRWPSWWGWMTSITWKPDVPCKIWLQTHNQHPKYTLEDPKYPVWQICRCPV